MEPDTYHSLCFRTTEFVIILIHHVFCVLRQSLARFHFFFNLITNNIHELFNYGQ